MHPFMKTIAKHYIKEPEMTGIMGSDRVKKLQREYNNELTKEVFMTDKKCTKYCDCTECVKPQYNEGDRLTVVIDNDQADCLNRNSCPLFYPRQIIHVEPAPKPIVGLFTIHSTGDVMMVFSEKYDGPAPPQIGKLKITYYPNGAVEAEVVS